MRVAELQNVSSFSNVAANGPAPGNRLITTSDRTVAAAAAVDGPPSAAHHCELIAYGPLVPTSPFAWLEAVVARQPRLHRLAHFAARRMAGRAFVSSLAVVVDGDDVLLARQRFRGDTWGLPGGWVRRREEPAIGCEREVREETGIEVNVVAIVASELHTLNGRPARYGGVTLAFYCTPRAPIDRTRPPRSVELSELRWVPHVLCDGFVHGFSLKAIDAAFAHG